MHKLLIVIKCNFRRLNTFINPMVTCTMSVQRRLRVHPRTPPTLLPLKHLVSEGVEPRDEAISRGRMEPGDEAISGGRRVGEAWGRGGRVEPGDEAISGGRREGGAWGHYLVYILNNRSL